MHKKIDSNIGMSYFGVVYGAGGAWESEGTRGCSHLMEHLMAKTYEHLYPKMRQMSISDNAYTDDNVVVFWAMGLDECLTEMSQEIIDTLTEQKSLWTKEQFETEKKIVLQEYSDCFNDQSYASYLNALRKYYNYCDPIGFRKDVENFSYEDSLKMANDVFRTPKKIVTVGRHDVKFDGQFSDKKPNYELAFGNYDLFLEDFPIEDQTVVNLIHKVPFDISKGPAINLLIQCVAHGLESPLYQEVREKRGLAYGVRFGDGVVGKDGLIYGAVQTKNENTEELLSTLNTFFSTDMSELITKERFYVCKSGSIYTKKIATVLPHDGALVTELSEYNKFEGLEDLTYDDIVELGREVLTIDNIQLVVN